MHPVYKAFVMTLLVPASAWAAPLFEADPYRLLEIANRALHEKYPDLPPGSVPLSNDIYVYCEPAEPRKRNLLLDEEFRACEASVVYDLSGTSQPSYYHDGSGRCLQADPPGWAEVQIFSDGSAGVKPFRSRDIEVDTVECSDEVISELAWVQEPVPGVEDAFEVDPNVILDTAFLAAIDRFPNVNPGQLDIEFKLFLICDVYPNENPRPQPEIRVRPCVAEVILMDRSASVFKVEADQKGRCWRTESVPSFRVIVDSLGKENIRSGGTIEMARENTRCED